LDCLTVPLPSRQKKVDAVVDDEDYDGGREGGYSGPGEGSRNKEDITGGRVGVTVIVEKGDDSNKDYVVSDDLSSFLPEYQLGAIVVEVSVWCENRVPNPPVGSFLEV
jgi:hypothetical protein